MSSSLILILGAVVILLTLAVRLSLRKRSMMQVHPRELTAEEIKHGSLVLLDVRTVREHREGHIRGSVHIPLHELRDRLKELERYRERRILCYCQSGSRSISAALLLKKKGFTVANLSGGISEWNYQQLRQQR
ncbi:MAG TPA: rhodanese-like domain-containing protein [Bacteroidota bacterium]|nr:rhodanese-like domain-containing protein [Bacteroidota bacterium]